MENEIKTTVKDSDNTTTTITDSSKHSEESQMFGVTVRGWIAAVFVLAITGNKLLVTSAVLWHAIVTKDFSLVGSLVTIDEPLYSLSIVAIGYYFGAQKMKGAAMTINSK